MNLLSTDRCGQLQPDQQFFVLDLVIGGLESKPEGVLELDPLEGGEDDSCSTALLIRGFVFTEYLGRDFWLQVGGKAGWCDLLSRILQIGEFDQEIQ